MISALWRKLRADLKSNKLQFALIWGVLALSAMLLMISLLMLDSTEEPWDRTFEATNGPHLWILSHQYDLDFTPLTEHPAVTESSEVILALAENPMVMGDEKQDIFLYAMDVLPRVAHPLIAEGRWLDPANPGEVVLDFSLARYFEFQIGDKITILAADGNRSLTIVGLAVTAHWFPYNEITKDVSPGVAYISQATLEVIQPDSAYWYSVVGLRLKEPENSKEFGDQLPGVFPGKLRTVLDWQYVKENASLANTLNGMFLGLFSILGLAAVGLIVFNTIGGQVLSQYRNIGLLKAVGVKPSQVTLMFLGEHLVIGLTAAIAGIAIGLVLAPDLVSSLAENLNTTPPDIYAPGPLLVVLVLVEATVGLATLLPAWQGGRINTVQAISVGYRSHHRRASLLAKLTAWLRMPSVVRLGVKDTFSRPLRAVLAISSLFLTVLVAITAVGALTTTEYLANNRVYFNGTSADMKVIRNFVLPSIIEDEILGSPEVADYYEEILLFGQASGHSDQPIAVRILKGNYKNFDFHIKEGRMISAPGEAVMGYAVFDMLEVQVGDTIEILIDGYPIKLAIVGRHTENFMLNNVLITSFETYQDQVESDLQTQTYYVQLKDYESAQGLRKDWLDQSQRLLNVIVITEEPLASVVQLTNLIVSLGAILMIVAGTNLMSTSLLSIRERIRDFGIQKALGITPTQIAGSVVVGAVMIVLIALLIGITLGVSLMEWFISQVGIAIGAGPDFYIIHWGGMSLLLPILVLLAVVSSLLPAIRAARLEVVEALRYE
ncbi:MAG: FtsX-like permease family protein [Anaerolineales bacterium]